MRQILLLLLIPFCTLGQVKLTTHPLELKKSKDFHQMITASNKQNQNVLVFGTDKEKVTLLQYSPFLFLKDSMTTKRPSIDYKFLTGYAIGNNNQPTLYWSNRDFTAILGVEYDLQNKTTVQINYALPLSNEKVLQVFNENNSFYLLTQKKGTEVLLLYVFKDGKKKVYKMDFAAIEFENFKKEPLTLEMILSVYPLVKIETRAYNALATVTSPSKFYVREKDIIFTFDHNFNNTQVLQLDFGTNRLLERMIPQVALTRRNGMSNSYYHENKLYQLTANNEELHFGIKSFDTGAMEHDFGVTKNDSITFKNSPFLIQLENRPTKTIKTTAKFLQQLQDSNLGVSVYKTPKALFLTIGGNRILEQTLMSFSFAAEGFDPRTFYVASAVYFESVFDKKGNPIKSKPEPLAIDFYNRFLYDHPEAVLNTILKHQNYYLHSYYDTRVKQIVLQKFYDGF